MPQNIFFYKLMYSWNSYNFEGFMGEAVLNQAA